MFITILGAKGGACFLTQYPSHIKLVINTLEYLQTDLRTLDNAFPEEMKAFTEDNMLGIFDYCQDTHMNILNSIKDKFDTKQVSLKMVKTGIYARQLSATLKYVVHAINTIDHMCVKHMAEVYDETLLQDLTQLAHISNKNRVSNQALRALVINEFVMQLLVSIMSAKTVDEIINKSAEITLVCEIIYQSKPTLLFSLI